MPESADTTIVEAAANEKVVETVKEKVEVTEGTAVVGKETVEAVVEATDEGQAVVLPLVQATEEKVEKAEVSAQALTAVAEKEADVVVELTEVKVKLDAAALKAVTEQAQGETIEIRAVKTQTAELTQEQQAGIADLDTAIVVTAQIFSNEEYIGDFKGGTATIMLPFTPAEGKNAEDYVVYYIDEEGNLVEVASEYVDGHMVFTTGHFSDYVIAYNQQTSSDSLEVGSTALPIVIVAAAMLIVIFVVVLARRKTEKE